MEDPLNVMHFDGEYDDRQTFDNPFTNGELREILAAVKSKAAESEYMALHYQNAGDEDLAKSRFDQCLRLNRLAEKIEVLL